MPYTYFKGNIEPLENAVISIASNSLQYGNTCFAGIRGYCIDGAVRTFRLEDHHQRLMNAAKILGMDYFIDFPSFKGIIAELIARNSPRTDFYIRPFIFSQDQKVAPKHTGLSYELAVYMVPMANYFDPDRGMRLMVSSWRKFSDLSFPTKSKVGGSYVNSILATSEAQRCGYDEALMTDQEGSIVEASVANILVSYRNRILMPPVGSALLEGITKRTVVELLEEEGTPVQFERIDRSMAYTCDELLLMGTAAQIAYAESVDGRAIGHKGPGPLCKMLRQKYASIIRNQHPKSKQWITEFR